MDLSALSPPLLYTRRHAACRLPSIEACPFPPATPACLPCHASTVERSRDTLNFLLLFVSCIAPCLHACFAVMFTVPSKSPMLRLSHGMPTLCLHSTCLSEFSSERMRVLYSLYTCHCCQLLCLPGHKIVLSSRVTLPPAHRGLRLMPAHAMGMPSPHACHTGHTQLGEAMSVARTPLFMLWPAFFWQLCCLSDR